MAAKERPVVHGYSGIKELDLKDDAIIKFTETVENRGDFVGSVEGDGYGSLSSMFHAPDTVLYEFTGGHFVVIADGEYINCAWFPRGKTA